MLRSVLDCGPHVRTFARRRQRALGPDKLDHLSPRLKDFLPPCFVIGDLGFGLILDYLHILVGGGGGANFLLQACFRHMSKVASLLVYARDQVWKRLLRWVVKR